MEKIDPREFKNEVLGSGFTMKQLCEEAGIADTLVSSWVNTPRSITTTTYNKLVEAFESLKEAE